MAGCAACPNCVDRTYRRIDIPPVAHKAIQKALFGGSTVPGLVLDGRRVLGSLHIIRALEEKVAEPRLLPADRKERKSVQLAESWGDEVLQPLVRRVIWSALKREPTAIPSYSEGSKLAVPAPLARVSAPLIARAEHAHLDNHLARVERWIEHEVIGGDQPNAADLQIGAGLRLLLTIEDVAAAVGSRPASQLAFKWFPRYPGRVPGGVLPAAWLA
jgi:glutathione S-transferase